MAQRHSIVTVAGRNKEAAKLAANTPLVFTHIALGSGDRFPSGGETELENEVHRGQITSSGVESGQANAAWFDLYVPNNVNTFHAQEIGLFDEDGVLFALSRYPEPVPKFGPDSSSVSDNTFRIIVVFADTENVVVRVNPVSGLTANNLTQHLPWATDEQAADPNQTKRIIDPKQLHALQAKTDAYGLVRLAADLTDNEQNNKNVVTAGMLRTQMESVGVIGSIIVSTANSAPAGTLECNGAAVSRTLYPELFAVVGTVFGAGDGSTTFNIPDLRGEFLRGWDNGRGVDAARAFASQQADEFKAHFHEHSSERITAGNGSGIMVGGDAANAAQGYPIATTSVGGSETRPRNVALMFCIKY
ncbi:MAG: phage tail protein [Cohaesibacter sp.]|jgi:phage-related tail fiber protein|nr:phage tail protein [Cohaesibacter sp.]